MRLFVCECCAGGGKENGVFSLRSALEDVISVPYQFPKQLTRRDFNEMCEIKLTGKGLLLDLQSCISFDFESRLSMHKNETWILTMARVLIDQSNRVCLIKRQLL